MKAPDDCNGCGYAQLLGTRGGEPNDSCTHERNKDKFASAPICKTIGLYKTPTEIRADDIHHTEELRRIEFLNLRNSDMQAFAKQALMGGK